MARGRSAMAAALFFGCLVAASISFMRGGAAGPALAAAGTQRSADVINGLTQGLVQILKTLIPGLCVASVCAGVYNRRQTMSKKEWTFIATIFFLVAVAWAAVVWASGYQETKAPVRRQIAEAQPHSGEIIAEPKGFYRLPDPTLEKGEPVEEGWQKNLAKTMSGAIRSGDEQVMLLFSRQGCPWCDRQMPVIAEAIRARTAMVMNASREGEAEAVTADTAMTHKPLRVFVLDASEFPQLMQQFGVQAFPTSLTFGRPGATPIMAQGYLNGEQLAEVYHQAAMSTNEKAPTRRKRRGLFGLR